MMTCFLITYTFHCTWVTSEAYSSPSIVLSARSGDGGRIIFDDFREAYYWLRHNTPEVRKSALTLRSVNTESVYNNSLNFSCQQTDVDLSRNYYHRDTKGTEEAWKRKPEFISNLEKGRLVII